MAKSNPLFVDSTVLHGDRIGTQIELTHILLYEGETVSVVLTNHLREIQHVVMKLSDDGTYHVRVWLSHQKPISYRFILEKNGRTLLQSNIFEARAQYALIEEWEPESRKPREEEPPSLRIVPAEPRDDLQGRTFSTLMEKWGL